MDDRDQNVGVGGGRSPLDHMTLSDAEAAMHKGRGSMIAVAVVVMIAAVGGLFFMMGGDDERRVYGELGKTINGLRSGEFDQFWACALPGSDLRDIKSNEALVAKMEIQSAAGRARYGKKLRDECLPNLERIEPTLSALILPDDLKPGVGELVRSMGDLRGAVSNLASYLDQPELDYDEDDCRDRLKPIARGWYDYRKAHGETNNVLREHLGR